MCLPDGSQVSSSCSGEGEVFDAVGNSCGLPTTTTTREPIVCDDVSPLCLGCSYELVLLVSSPFSSCNYALACSFLSVIIATVLNNRYGYND